MDVIPVTLCCVPGEGQQIRVGPPTEPDYLRPVYANTLNINFTPYDFKLTFSLLNMPLEIPPGADPGEPIEVHPSAVAEVIVPATLMHALISVINDQFDRYLEQFGPPGLDPQGPGRQEE